MDPARILLHRFDQLYVPPNNHHAAYNQTIAELPAERDVVHARNSLVGPVPEIEEGEMFRVRYELMLAGLHNDPVRGICRGPSPLNQNLEVATCVVLRYPRHNFMLRGTLIVGGETGDIAAANRMGVRVLHHQNLQSDGNIAMRNSELADTSVRVLVYSRRAIGGRYIYRGLYMVEGEREVHTPQGFLVREFFLHPAPPANN